MNPAYRTLISADELKALASDAPPVLLDCRFDLADPAFGERAYAEGHLPGAFYLSLDRDLSGAKLDATGGFHGRHPLPDRAAFATLVGTLGIAPGTQVVAYDGQGGMYAARAWWMLRWLGHEAVAVLDGGIAAWKDALATQPALVDSSRSAYPATETSMPTVDADALARRLGRVALIDARAPERYRGEVEPIDKAAGHIPGAFNRFLKTNLQADGRFKPAAILRAEYDALIAGRPVGDVVHQCGSGVTACHNLLAMEHAGLAGSTLYPGSWSDWSADPGRPIARA